MTSGWHVETAEGRRDITTVDCGHRENRDTQREANARLIAAAPELLSELRDFVKSAESYMKYHGAKFYDAGFADRPLSGLNPQIAKAKAAIAKAEGRS